MQTRQALLEDLINRIDELALTLEERADEGDDLALARDLVEELREEVVFKLEG